MGRSRVIASSVAAALPVVALLHGQTTTLVPASATITLPADITSLTALNGSSRVAAGLADGRVAVWTGRDRTSATLVKPHAARVLAVGSSADGQEVWSVAVDASVSRTRIAAGSRPVTRQFELGAASARAAAFSSDGSMLVTGSEFGEIRVFDTATGALGHTLRGHRTELQSLAVRPGATTVASASAEADLRIWDAAAGRELAFIDGDLSLFALGFSPRDGTLAAGGVDRRVTFRQPDAFTPIGVLALPAPKLAAALAWSPDGRLVAVGDIDDESLSKGGIQVVDAAGRASVANLDTGGAPASALVFAGDAGRIVGVVGRELRAWTLKVR